MHVPATMPLAGMLSGNLPVPGFSAEVYLANQVFGRRGSGTVTSVAQTFTGGIISVAGSPITTSGTIALTVAGTSGGIPFFNSATSWATSAVLSVNQIVRGGGAGAAPSASANATFDGTTLSIIDNFVVLASGAALPAFRMKDLDVSTSDFSALTVLWATNTIFAGSGASSADGGANFLGFTNTTVGAFPLVFTGYSGSPAPTVGGILFRAAKWNGTTNAVRRADTEICLSFRNWTDTDAMTVVGRGSVGFGVVAPTARGHFAAGTTAASTAPVKFTSGSLLTTAEAMAVEALTDNLHFTITTGAARKGIVLDDGTRLTSGRIPAATTNGRLIDGPTPAADGTYLTPASITIVKGIITAIS